MSRDIVLEQFPRSESELKHLVREGLIVEQQLVKDRLQVKRVLTVYPPEPPEKLEEALTQLSARAVKTAGSPPLSAGTSGTDRHDRAGSLVLNTTSSGDQGAGREGMDCDPAGGSAARSL